MKKLVQQQRHLLLKRLDVLSPQLKIEVDSLRADEILQEMHNIGNLLQELVNIPVANHPFTLDPEFKEHGKTGYQAKIAK
ncbi:hypothetical protein MKY07_06220 [Solibacillus sp. FSL W7-1472]|uniref:hypothetical protein n=1 Tax=Solibacillus sp. FSL W7-1472 TaxID=2921707 RepID=UPI0030DCDDA3